MGREPHFRLGLFGLIVGASSSLGGGEFAKENPGYQEGSWALWKWQCARKKCEEEEDHRGPKDQQAQEASREKEEAVSRSQ